MRRGALGRRRVCSRGRRARWHAAVAHAHHGAAPASAQRGHGAREVRDLRPAARASHRSLLSRLDSRFCQALGPAIGGLLGGRGGHLGRHGCGLDDGAARDATVSVGGSLIVGSSGGGSAVA